MMVPKCFLYSSPSPPSSRRRKGNDIRSGTPSSTQVRECEKEKDVVGRTPLLMSTAPPSLSSPPMVIPTRSHPRASRQHQSRSAGTQCNTNAPHTVAYKHDPEALPPALGALLAVTAIPPPSKRSGVERQRKCRRHGQKQCPACGLQVGELKAGDSELVTGFTSSSLEILLSSPHDTRAIAALDSDLVRTSEETVRSSSTDSIPSLENDSESTTSSYTPSTPGPGSRRVNVERRQKTLSSPRAQECALDHPLLSQISEPASCWKGESTDFGRAHVTTPPRPPKSLLKSNLTASLRLLQSAARSVSNFTAPVVPHYERLTRSMLAIQPHRTDDRRPLPSGEPPDPVLRRYLNPIGASPAELHMHSGSFGGGRSDLACKFSVQLQTYRRSSADSKTATSPPVFLSRDVDGREASREAAQAAQAARALEIRQREPRENGDFLRIIVMEMNMRREGKLADHARGKARLWLPPREPCRRQSRHDGDAPKRWVSREPGH